MTAPTLQLSAQSAREIRDVLACLRMARRTRDLQGERRAENRLNWLLEHRIKRIP